MSRDRTDAGPVLCRTYGPYARNGRGRTMCSCDDGGSGQRSAGQRTAGSGSGSGTADSGTARGQRSVNKLVHGNRPAGGRARGACDGSLTAHCCNRLGSVTDSVLLRLAVTNLSQPCNTSHSATRRVWGRMAGRYRSILFIRLGYRRYPRSSGPA